MNFDPSDEQTQFRTTVERFVLGAGGWTELGALGLLALPASSANGGIDGSILDCAIVAEAMGRGIARDPWLECAYWPLRLLETLDQPNLTSRIATGELRAAVAFAEPSGRYETQPRHVRATRSGDRWTVSGTKHFVLGGGAADIILVTASTPDGPALFAIRRCAVETTAYTVVDGRQAVELNLRGDAADRLGALDEALPRAVAETRLIAAAEILGLAGRLFDDTLGYVRQREQFGQPIGRFQAIQHRMVDSYAALEQMRSMLWRALLAPPGDDAWRQAAGAKGFIAEGALRIGHEAIQLHGGMGVTDELPIGHAHKRVLLLSRLFGDPAADLALFAEAA